MNQKKLVYDVFFMDEKEIKVALKSVDSLETVEDAINNIAKKYTINSNEETYEFNKKMLTEFAKIMGLIKRKDVW